MALKFAVVGTGWVAAEYWKAIQRCNGAELYAVVSGNADRARKRLGEEGAEAKIYTDYSNAVKDPEVDAVVLCSLPDVRPQQAVLAAQHGKHMVLEKPLGLDRSGLNRMTEALENYPVRTAVSFVLRWNPTVDTIKTLIADDALGRIFMAQIDYWHYIGPQYAQYRWSKTAALGGSSILSAGCHAVDVLRYLSGEIMEVKAYGCRTWADSDYEFDPNALAIFKLRNGAVGKVSSSLECHTSYKFNIHLLGEKGTMINNQLYSRKFPGQTDFATIPMIAPDSGDVAHHPFGNEIAEFVDSILNHRTTRCDFFDAKRTMEVCFAIDESIATGRTVAIAE